MHEEMHSINNVQIVSSIECKSAGPSYSVVRLAEALSASGSPASIMCLGNSTRDEILNGVHINQFLPDEKSWVIPRSVLPSRHMREGIDRAAMRGAILHNHGLWRMPNVYPGQIAKETGVPLVLSPRGMLGRAALQFSYVRKLIFWLLWQRSALSSVKCFHATAISELDDIRAFGLKAPVAVIPNGIDLPVIGRGGVMQSKARNSDQVFPYILSLGRLHPKKGLDMLIAAFARISKEFPQWRLRIVGPDEEGYASLLRREISEHGLLGRVTVEPAAYDGDKLRLMREAEFFVLSTKHENFAMTVAESLAVETPVISTHGAPWAGLVDHQCGWWVPYGVDEMANSMRTAILLPREERRKMGVRGREWMARDFHWDGVGSKMVSVYSWLMGQGMKPDWVAD